jgi:hypothetical protein
MQMVRVYYWMPRRQHAQNFEVRALNVDFLAFSIHKMCGPVA